MQFPQKGDKLKDDADLVSVESAAQVGRPELFDEYWRSFGFAPCFQGFAGEVAGLPGDYVPPGGRVAGCR